MGKRVCTAWLSVADLYLKKRCITAMQEKPMSLSREVVQFDRHLVG